MLTPVSILIQIQRLTRVPFMFISQIMLVFGPDRGPDIIIFGYATLPLHKVIVDKLVLLNSFSLRN